MNLHNCFIKHPNDAIPIVRVKSPHTAVIIAPLAVVGGGAGILIPPSCVVQDLELRDTSEVWTGPWTLCCDKTKRKEIKDQAVFHCEYDY